MQEESYTPENPVTRCLIPVRCQRCVWGGEGKGRQRLFECLRKVYNHEETKTQIRPCKNSACNFFLFFFSARSMWVNSTRLAMWQSSLKRCDSTAGSESEEQHQPVYLPVKHPNTENFMGSGKGLTAFQVL